MDRDIILEQFLPELMDIEHFIENELIGDVEVIAHCPKGSISEKSFSEIETLPVYKITFGSRDRSTPLLAIVGGVHGLERIGTQVAKSLMFSFNELAKWDQHLKSMLESIRIIFIPLINPWGMALNRRSNGFGIDLMRNSPVEAEGKKVFLLSGHRWGTNLPWFRGQAGQPMQIESSALISTMLNELEAAQSALSLDIHSGFGFRDQLWFPYARTTKPFPHLAEMMAIKNALDQSYPYHIYKVEPQALNYVTHGDLWDYIYDQNLQKNKNSLYIPLCLEMGSWTWVKKNPSQLFKPGGIFDPILPHRRHRAMRRHHLLFDLLLRLVANPEKWTLFSEGRRAQLIERAHDNWYANLPSTEAT